MKFSDQRPEVDGRPDAGLRGPGRKHQDLEHHLEAGVKEVGIAVDIGLWMLDGWFKPPTSSSKYFSFSAFRCPLNPHGPISTAESTKNE